MPAIWTDSDDVVKRIHYKPEKLTTEQRSGSISVDSIPEPDYSKGMPTQYCTSENGIWIEYESGGSQ
jgi:hypothetical protein